MASKIKPKSKVIDSRDMERILGEIDVLREVNHANLLRLVDIVHTEDFLYIITGRGGEDLFEYLSRQQGPVSDIKAHIIMRQVFAGVLALHDQGFCHRDLKPENLLLDQEGYLKITGRVNICASASRRSWMFSDRCCFRLWVRKKG